MKAGSTLPAGVSRRRFWVPIRLGLPRQAVIHLRRTTGSALATVQEVFGAVLTALRCVCRFEDGETEVVGFNVVTGGTLTVPAIQIRIASALPEWVDVATWPVPLCEQRAVESSASLRSGPLSSVTADAADVATPDSDEATPSRMLAILIEAKGESLPITSEYHNRRFRLGFYLDGQAPRVQGGEMTTVNSLAGTPGGLQEILVRGSTVVGAVTGPIELSGLHDLPPRSAIAWTAAIEVMGKQKVESAREVLDGIAAYVPPVRTQHCDRSDPFTVSALRALHSLHRATQISFSGGPRGVPREGGISEMARVAKLIPSEHAMTVSRWTMFSGSTAGTGVVYRQGRDAANERYTTADLPVQVTLPAALRLAPAGDTSTGGSAAGERGGSTEFGPVDFAAISSRLSVSLVSFDFVRLREYVTTLEQESGTVPEFRSVCKEDLWKLHEQSLIPFSVFAIEPDGRTLTLAIERKNWPVSSRHATRPMRLVICYYAGELTVDHVLRAAEVAAGVRARPKSPLRSVFVPPEKATDEAFASTGSLFSSGFAEIFSPSFGGTIAGAGATASSGGGSAAGAGRPIPSSSSKPTQFRAVTTPAIHYASPTALAAWRAASPPEVPSGDGNLSAHAFDAPRAFTTSAMSRRMKAAAAAPEADDSADSVAAAVTSNAGGAGAGAGGGAVGNVFHNRLSKQQVEKLVAECTEILRDMAFAWTDPFEVKAKAPALKKSALADGGGAGASAKRSYRAGSAKKGDGGGDSDSSEAEVADCSAGGVPHGALPAWVTIPSHAVKNKTRGLRSNPVVIAAARVILSRQTDPSAMVELGFGEFSRDDVADTTSADAVVATVAEPENSRVKRKMVSAGGKAGAFASATDDASPAPAVTFAEGGGGSGGGGSGGGGSGGGGGVVVAAAKVPAAKKPRKETKGTLATSLSTLWGPISDPNIDARISSGGGGTEPDATPAAYRPARFGTQSSSGGGGVPQHPSSLGGVIPSGAGLSSVLVLSSVPSAGIASGLAGSGAGAIGGPTFPAPSPAAFSLAKVEKQTARPSLLADESLFVLASASAEQSPNDLGDSPNLLSSGAKVGFGKPAGVRGVSGRGGGASFSDAREKRTRLPGPSASLSVGHGPRLGPFNMSTDSGAGIGGAGKPGAMPPFPSHRIDGDALMSRDGLDFLPKPTAFAPSLASEVFRTNVSPGGQWPASGATSLGEHMVGFVSGLQK